MRRASSNVDFETLVALLFDYRKVQEVTKYTVWTTLKWISKKDFLTILLISQFSTYDMMYVTATAFTAGQGFYYVEMIIAYALVGIPMMVMELFLGYFSQRGPLLSWKIAPVLQGIGYTMVLRTLGKTIVLCIWLTELLWYSVLTLLVSIPWDTCNFTRADPNICYNLKNDTAMLPYCPTVAPGIPCSEVRMEVTGTHFYRREILQIQNFKRESSFGTLQESLFPVLLLIWILYFVIYLFYELQAIIKAMYKILIIFFGFCIILLIILIIYQTQSAPVFRSFVAEQMKTDISEIFAELVHTTVDSMCLSSGLLILLGSLMPFNASLVRSVILASVIKYAVLVVFACVYGYSVYNIAYAAGVNLESIAGTGAEATFGIIPQFLHMLPFKYVTLLSYFSILAAVTFMNEYLRIYLIIHCVFTYFPNIRHYKIHVITGICCTGVALSSFMLTTKPMALQEELLMFLSTVPLLVIITLEAAAVFWMYGITRLSGDMYFMLDFNPTFYWRLCWSVLPGIYIFTCSKVLAVYFDRSFWRQALFSKVALLLLIGSILLPFLIVGVYNLSIYYQHDNTIGAFEAERSWGPPDKSMLKLRKLFRPKTQTRFNCLVKHTCKHNCLIDNSKLAKDIAQEEISYKAYTQFKNLL